MSQQLPPASTVGVTGHQNMGSLQTGQGHISPSRLHDNAYYEDSLFPKLQRIMTEQWSIYSKPVPADSRELWALFLQCSCITVLLGGLFYNWLFASLEYPQHISIAMAITFSLLLLLALFLLHPVRCAFSITMPTLGTKQGRKLLLSACIMIAVVNITPNIISNIKTLLQVILCISKNSSESLLNSTDLLENASWKLGDEIKNYAILKPMDGHFQFSLVKNNSWINQVHLAGEKARKDFLAVEVLVKDCVRAGNKLVAAFSVLYLCFESIWYLKNYLTNLRFDNIYITKKLQRLAEDGGASHLLVGSAQRLIRPTGLRLSREELMLCLAQALRLSVALLLVLVVVALEHLVFGVADVAVRRMAQLSAVPITLSIKYQAEIDFLKISLPVKDVDRSYHHSLTFSSAGCRISPPIPPNPSVLLVVGLLFCIIYATVFLETYARRLCRKISASFFESREDERARYLYGKLSRQHRKQHS